jgi:hypothetical protein
VIGRRKTLDALRWRGRRLPLQQRLEAGGPRVADPTGPVTTWVGPGSVDCSPVTARPSASSGRTAQRLTSVLDRKPTFVRQLRRYNEQATPAEWKSSTRRAAALHFKCRGPPALVRSLSVLLVLLGSLDRS